MATGPANFQELPTPLKIGVLLAGGGGLMAGVGVLVSEYRWLGPIIIGGIIAIGLLLVLYAQFLKWHKGRKARPMEHQMFRGAGASQQVISDPQQLAKLDDLRKKFEEGIGTFRAAGKSLYSLPWHVILGEPGSGKTEAIKHCGIGFPPGLNDPYRGTGGTINMDWWFTDHGVLIDTAGKLMFEEAHSGGSRQWREFLGLLRKWRRDCPINGALLVIPADSLICDTAEEIERKAGQIAQQFDMIQRTLDVRFPVYVVITKSDLINGFREFFANITDPQLQHQILGWSNSGDMDKPYDPGFVDRYLEDMKTRLFRARLTRLGELQCEEAQEQDRPTAEALYAFPLAFEQLGPRLRRYLDLIFSVGSQWSCKPLFFRGIYFTSSMQEGAALDEDLAQALGVPVGSLPEGPVWKRDRALFLRDLFLSKVFPERGLVTRATNARKQYARRQAAVLGAVAGGLLLLLALTIYGGFTFSKSIKAVERLLKVAVSPDYSIAIIDPNSYAYAGHGELRKNGKPDKDLPLRYGYFDQLTQRAVAWKEGQGIPRVFRPGVALMTLEPNDAARRLYVVGALQPMLRAAADKMKQDDGVQMETRAEYEALYESLCQLLALRATDSFPARPGFDRLFRYTYPTEYGQYPDHRESLMKPADTLGALAPWDETLTREAVDKAIENGLKLFDQYWPRFSLKENTRLIEIKQAIDHVKAFENVERRLIDITGTREPKPQDLDQWVKEDFPAMQMAKRWIDADKGALRCASLQAEWEGQVKKPRNDAQSRYSALLRACGTDANRPGSPMYKHYESLRGAQERCLADLEDPALGTLDNQFWKGDAYQGRFLRYQADVNCLKAFPRPADVRLAGLPAIVAVGRDLIQTARKEIRGWQPKTEASPYASDAHRAAQVLLTHGERGFYREVVKWWSEHVGEKTSPGALVQKEAQQEYDPKMGPCACAAWKQVKGADQDPNGPRTLTEGIRRIDTAYETYVEKYVAYWQGDGGCRELDHAIPPASNWRTRHDQLADISVNANRVFDTLEDIRRKLRDNLERVQEYLPGTTPTRDLERPWKPERDLRAPIATNWSDFGADPRSARQKLLSKVQPVDAFLRDYFGSRKCPALSADYYWYQLGLDSLRLLVKDANVDIGKELQDLEPCQYRFPLSKQRQSSKEDAENNDLTPREAEGIYRLLKSAEDLSVSVPGQEALTGNPDIDGLLKELRSGPALPSWVRGIDVLPVCPEAEYSCQVTTIKTTPLGRIRKVIISQGGKSIVGTNPYGDTWIAKGVLPYDCSGDEVDLKFYARTEDPNSQPLEPRVPAFRGFWPWHRMVKDTDFRNGAYEYKRELEYNKEPITVTITLQFYRMNKRQTDAKAQVLAIFPPMN